jgi:hypothetical protein
MRGWCYAGGFLEAAGVYVDTAPVVLRHGDPSRVCGLADTGDSSLWSAYPTAEKIAPRFPESPPPKRRPIGRGAIDAGFLDIYETSAGRTDQPWEASPAAWARFPRPTPILPTPPEDLPHIAGTKGDRVDGWDAPTTVPTRTTRGTPAPRDELPAAPTAAARVDGWDAPTTVPTRTTRGTARPVSGDVVQTFVPPEQLLAVLQVSATQPRRDMPRTGHADEGAPPAAIAVTPPEATWLAWWAPPVQPRRDLPRTGRTESETAVLAQPDAALMLTWLMPDAIRPRPHTGLVCGCGDSGEPPWMSVASSGGGTGHPGGIVIVVAGPFWVEAADVWFGGAEQGDLREG